MESEEDDCYYIKCYHLGDSTRSSYWQSYEVKNAEPEAEAELQSEGEFPPGMGIPGFIAYGRRDPRLIDIGISDIDSASEAMREHYKLECEAYQSIQFAKTLIRADKGISIPAHAGAIVRAMQGQVEPISVDTGDVDKIIAKQRDILEQIEALTGLGGLHSMRTERYRFTVWVDRNDHSKVDATELYDHQTDPQENTNIANVPANAALVGHLMEQWRKGWQGTRPGGARG